jgi:predicted transcriptional regulator
MKTMKEMIIEANKEWLRSPLRVDSKIIQITQEEKSPVIKINRLKTACNPIKIETIADRLSYLETKGLLKIYRQRENETVKIHSIELTAFGKAVAKEERFIIS